MKNLFFKTILFFFATLSVLGQKKIPNNKYNTTSATDVNNQFIGNVDELSHLRFVIAYSHMNFLNQKFSQNIADDIVKQSYGFNLGFEYFFKHFKFGMRFTNNVFELTAPQLTEFSKDQIKINSIGVDSCLNLMLLPQVKHASLFIGGGYSYHSLKLNTENGKENKSFGEPIWNAGIDIFISKRIKFFGEYVQSINNGSENAISKINGGIGITY